MKILQRQTKANKTPFSRKLAWGFLIALLFLTLFPIYWSVRTALSDNSELTENAGNFAPAAENGFITSFNYERVLTQVEPEEARAAGGSGRPFSLVSALGNSIIVSTAITVFQVGFSAMAAYAFARLEFKGREVLFTLYLTALLVPPIFTLIPNFTFVRDLEMDLGFVNLDFSWLPFADDRDGFTESKIGLIAPFMFMTPFAVFFLRQFFLGISTELEEAAALDGAGHIRRFTQIIAPMAVAPLFTLAILTYVTAWNEFLWPFTVGRDEENWVLTVALQQFKAQSPGINSPDWTGFMAATSVAAAPILVIFAVFGRRVVDSIQFSGIK